MQNLSVKSFNDAYEAQMYAKSNPGVIVSREGSSFVARGSKNIKLVSSITPNDILEHLNMHVVSQDEAKQEISQALYYHYLKYETLGKKEMPNSLPLMFVGPTGSGKTFIVQKACQMLDLVFVHINAASMVPTGIQGYSIDSMAPQIMRLAKNDMKKALTAVVFFDEIDKLFLNSDKSNYGNKIASQLLRLLEGTEITLNSNDTITTQNMFFILGGAFQDIVDQKSQKKSVAGFANKDDLQSAEPHITLEDLYAHSVPKELLGRVGTLINLAQLKEDDYYKILKLGKNSPLYEFTQKVEYHGASVKISDETLRHIANTASKSKLGVRGLRQLIKPFFDKALFEAPTKCAMGLEYVLEL